MFWIGLTAIPLRVRLEFLTCYAWMEDPGDLPRSLDYTVFAARAGRALVANGIHIPSTPPVGRLGDWAILIHLAGYEDWRPRSPDGPTSKTSENGSSAPVIVPFDWAPWVLDGRQPAPGHPNPQGCCPTAPPARHRDCDRNDDGHGPRPRDPSTKSARVWQLFPTCSSDRAMRGALARPQLIVRRCWEWRTAWSVGVPGLAPPKVCSREGPTPARYGGLGTPLIPLTNRTSTAAFCFFGECGSRC